MMKFSLCILALLLVGAVSAATVEVVQTNPSPLVAGRYADITFRISTSASESAKNDVTLTIEETPFITNAGVSARFSRLEAGETLTTTLRVYIAEDTPEGDTVVTSILSSDSDGDSRTSHAVFIEAAARNVELAIGKVTSVPDLLLPDTKNNKITLKLQNLGEKDAELVVADLLLKDGARASSAYSLRDSVARIDGGTEQDIVFTVDILEEARGTIDGTMFVRYRVRDDRSAAFETQSVGLSVSLPLDESPLLRVAAVETLTDATPGSTENKVRVTLVNDGVEEATDVRVRLFPDISYPFVFERTSQYVGAKIQPGANASVDFTFEVLGSASPKDYQLAVELESLVESTRYDRDDVIVITVAQGSETTVRQFALWTIGITLALSGLVAYLVRRGDTKKKK